MNEGHTERFRGQSGPRVWNLRGKWTWPLLLPASAVSTEGIPATLAGDYDGFDDVPEAAAAHDCKASLALVAEILIAEYVVLPISIVWANHADPLTEGG